MIKRTRMFIVIVVISFVLGAVITKYLVPGYFEDFNEVVKDNIENIVENNSMEENNLEESNLNSDKIEDENIKTVIEKTLEVYKDDDGIMYTLVDIDKDKIPELVVRTGEFEAEYMFYFYKYKAGDEKLELIGNIGAGHSVLYEMNDEKYLLCVYAHMGYESVAKVFIEDNKIKYEQISQRENLPNEDYSKGDKIVELYDLKDTSAIDEYNF